MTIPFATRRNNDGLVWIDKRVDGAFKRALLAGVPPNLRSKMKEALADIPDAGAMAHSIRYFGGPAKIADLKNQIAPLLIELDKLLTNQLRLPGFFDWLDVTGLGNHFKLIRVFKYWAEMKNG